MPGAALAVGSCCGVCAGGLQAALTRDGAPGSAVEVEGQFSTECGLGERCVSTRPLYILLVCIYLTKFLSYRKSTFFNVLTKSQAAAENFPFCTIDPNESRVPVPDDRFDFLCQYHKPPR